MKRLLTRSTKRLNLELEDDSGVTPLFMATTSNNAEAIKMLLSYGANVDKMTNTKPETALHMAAKKGLLESVQALVEGGANTSVLTTFE